MCFDPFHVVQLAQRAVDDVRRAEWNQQGKSKTGHGRWVKSVRWSLLKAPEHQTARQLAALHEVSHANKRLYRAFLLKEELRLLYHLDDPALAPDHLKAWLAWASRSKLKPFVKLARTIRRYRDGILAAIRLGLSKRSHGSLNSKVRLLSHRSFGFHGPAPLIASAAPGSTSTPHTDDLHTNTRSAEKWPWPWPRGPGPATAPVRARTAFLGYCTRAFRSAEPSATEKTRT